MGLDVTVLVNVRKAEMVEVDADGEPLDWKKYWRAHVDSKLQAYAGSIQDGLIYAHDGHKSFRVGSYGYYDRWLNLLAGMMGARNVDDFLLTQPGESFTSLMTFTDSDGVVYGAMVDTIADDFAIHDRKAMDCGQSDPEFYKVYDALRAQFARARTTEGAVLFH